MLHIALPLATIALTAGLAATIQPDHVETRTVHLTQTVTLYDIPAGAKQVRMWVPIPSDAPWQRITDRKVVSAPGTWRIERPQTTRGEFVYVELNNPTEPTASVVVDCTVQRTGMHYTLEAGGAGAIQPAIFADSLAKDAVHMEVDPRVATLADEACSAETDIAKQALLLIKAVSSSADHYSKNPSKPVCGRGAACDCLDQGGGCCTDLHSLFIAMARHRGIPARMQYGYRMLDAKAGPAYDPGYRCWVEFFVPGAGWIPTDIVASDNADETNPLRWGSLSATRVWVWEGRSFELNPKAAAGPIHTMTCGWAEIDGKPIDPVPSRDGKVPAQLRRTVQFEVLENNRPADSAKLPE